MTAAPLTINPIAQPTTGVAFQVTGSFVGGPSGLQYADGSGAFKTLPANIGTPQTTVNWSFLHPGASVGPLTIRLQYPGAPTYSATASVVVMGTPTPPNIWRIFSAAFANVFR